MIPFNHLGFFFKNFGSLIYPKKVLEELCQFLKPLSNQASVLDVGAGTGMMSEFAHRCNSELKYVAIDPAEGMLKFAPEYLETHIATAEALPFEDKSFDAVLMGESLHHLRDPELALKEIIRVLKKNGKLFIYDFDVSTFRGNAIYKMEKLLGEPAHFYEPYDLKNMLEGYGFSVEVSHYKWRYVVRASL
ncbi:MAG: ubiquinone/menaquinone biosynthesis C-methylase UbiE [Sulfurimonas sp.]|jgi:ubiquinone/menaquinone biosynthesis C-methylase UbiE|uniref:class I SAM-dependent methyltransferase n=1 Tax=Sulfurimonas sp. TaxID=2022749 RepID=UPI0039E436FA